MNVYVSEILIEHLMKNVKPRLYFFLSMNKLQRFDLELKTKLN